MNKLLSEIKCGSSIDPVTELISRALDDNNISNGEYSLILSKLEKFKSRSERILRLPQPKQL